MRDSDLFYNKQLVDYLKKNLRKGYTKESLKWALINQGHSRIEIDKAFQKLQEEMAKNAPVLKTKPDIKYEVVEPKIDVQNFRPSKKSLFKRFFRK